MNIMQVTVQATFHVLREQHQALEGGNLSYGLGRS